VPEASSVAPPVVPARLITRLVVSPLPVYWRVAPVAPLPMEMVPLATVVGAPKAEAVPRLAMLLMLRVPELRSVRPV
jgi:hypothetical protein